MAAAIDDLILRLRDALGINEFVNADLEAKETKRQTADYSHLHVVHEGESLFRNTFPAARPSRRAARQEPR